MFAIYVYFKWTLYYQEFLLRKLNNFCLCLYSLYRIYLVITWIAQITHPLFIVGYQFCTIFFHYLLINLVIILRNSVNPTPLSHSESTGTKEVLNNVNQYQTERCAKSRWDVLSHLWEKFYLLWITIKT